MKRVFILLLALALVVSCTACQSSTEKSTKEEKPFRLHIIANSDSEQDQDVKLKVRDAILANTLEQAKDIQTKDEMKAYVQSHLPQMEEIAQEVLEQNGFSYGAKAMVGTYDFPDKTYGEVTYPAGKYEALRIVLGEGEGQNWWCVIFPPLCLIDIQQSDEAQNNTEEKQTNEMDADEIVYSSLLVEWFEKLF